jgi:hypothetical protein
MAINVTQKVLDLETFAGVAQDKITRLEQRFAELERRLGDAETELKRVKARA